MILEFCAVALGGALGSVLRAVMMLQISTLLKPISIKKGMLMTFKMVSANLNNKIKTMSTPKW